MKKTIILLIISVSALSISAQTLKNNVISILEKYSSDTLFNGSIIIAQGNKMIYQASLGYKKFETKELNTQSTLFPIASLTKQFTSTAILILQENEKLSINDEISDYLELPKSMRDITIKNLMNHASGIPDYWQNNIENDKDSINKFLMNIESLEFPPNTNHFYCNSGYYLLGEIIESVSGKTYSDFLEVNIFKPLAMNHTFVNDGIEFNRAIGYNENWDRNDYLLRTGDGGIISTVEDLYLWDQALLENTILTTESRQTMFTPLQLENEEIIYYGLGWDINETNENIVSHTGWLASFGAYNQIDNENGYFIILLSNQIRPELMDLINEINGVLYKTDE